MDGAKDMLSAAIVVGLAGGIIQILQDGHIIDPILHSLASLMGETGKIVSLGGDVPDTDTDQPDYPVRIGQSCINHAYHGTFSDVIGLSAASYSNGLSVW